MKKTIHMKKFFFLSTLLLFINSQNFAQLMQASIGIGNPPNSAKIYLKSSVTVTSNISTLEFNVGIPETVSPKPTMTVLSTVFSGVNWEVSESHEGGYYNFIITTGAIPIVYQLTANTEFEALEVEFSGGGPIPTISLVTLPDGGDMAISKGLALFLCTAAPGTPQSDGSNLYYSRPGTSVENNFSYDITGKTKGTTTSTATIATALPIKLSGFSANNKDGDAILNWSVENQDAQSSRFEIEKSLNGTDFENIGAVNLSNSTGDNYSFTDRNVNVSDPATVVYYRLKMLDKDGQFTYSEIKNIRLYDKGLNISLFPNPAKSSSKLNLNLDNPGVVRISITNILGKQVSQTEFNGIKGFNQKNIDLSGFSAGSYMIKVQVNNRIHTIPVIKE